MRAKFKIQAEIGGALYKAGEHELPESALHNWFFEALVKDGAIILIKGQDDSQPLAEEAPQELVAEESPSEDKPVKTRGRKQKQSDD